MTITTVVFTAGLLAAPQAMGAGASMADDVTASARAQLSLAPATAAVQAPAEEADPFLQPVVDAKADLEAKRLAERSSYLTFHQAAGLTALGMLTGQVILGQYLLNEKREGIGQAYEQLQTAHMALGIGTFTVYSAAAIAQFLAPGIEEREGEFSTVTAHKLLALVHSTGMFVTPILGWYMVEEREKNTSDVDRVDFLNTVHQTTGYVTLGALAGAALVITF